MKHLKKKANETTIDNARIREISICHFVENLYEPIVQYNKNKTSF